MRILLKIFLPLLVLFSFSMNVVAHSVLEEAILHEAIGDVETAVAQFEEILAYNQRNLEKGTPEKNIYFFNYRSGQTLEYDNNGNLVFIYNRVDDTDPIYIDETTRADLNTRMVAFNSDPDNAENVKVYAFYINSVKLAIVSDYFDDLGNANSQSILSHLESKMEAAKNTDKADLYKKNHDQYKGFIDILNNRIKYTFDFGGNENNILIWGIRYRANFNKGTFIVRQSRGIKKVGLHVKENELGLKLYAKEMKEKRPTDESHSKTAEYYNNNILSCIEFFGTLAG